MRFADVIIDIHVTQLDRAFQYSIPEELLGRCRVGAPVLIPFGNAKLPKKGYVVGISDTPKLELSRIRPILDVVEKGMQVEDEMIALAAWIKEQYGGIFHDALKTVLPVKSKVEVREVREIVATDNQKTLSDALFTAEHKKHSAKARLLRELLTMPVIPYDVVTGKMNISPQTIRALTAAELITVREKCGPENLGEGLTVELNDEQSKAAETVIRGLGTNGKYLLYGVTGSGKTEVYMKVISEVLARGEQVIVLIPEIALTYQTVLRFYRCFGDRVAFMHSKLSAGERFKQWEKAKNGEISIMIGPRSALFAPFPKLGLIVIDEEQENSYKSDTSPKFHARETAVKRAEMHNASVILGSATPSLEAFYRAERGEYQLLRLTKRAKSSSMPTAHIVDMREELAAKNRSIFSRLLFDRMQDRLEKKEQIMLFLNRRGMAGFLSCRACGSVIQCPHCDISLSEHGNGRLQCHYCGYSIPKPATCPSCGSRLLAGWKAGTEKVEALVREEFPEARVLRMDADTTKKKEDYDRILSEFSDGEADILIGTQMIVKGHDFSGVTLMGVLAADMSLFASDYRSGERTFQLLAQAAGRAGRNGTEGEVVIQTYRPDHYAVLASAAQDYEAFYEQEIAFRDAMDYPPVGNLLVVLATNRKEEAVERCLAGLSELIGKDNPRKVRIVGPAPAGRRKINDMYRGVLMLKHPDYNALVEAKNKLETAITTGNIAFGCNVLFDFNPMNGY